MGLDMYAYYCSKELVGNKEVDFDVDYAVKELEAPYVNKEFFYWRKHPDLHRWMQGLYLKKGGEEFDFNCTNLRLTEEDLVGLEVTLKVDNLPQNEGGFFFGQSSRDKDEYENDLEFIRMAREYLAQGYAVYYYAWY
jgi:hypothetical protein